MKIELNEQEATVLLNLINIAVKATGIDAAEAGLHFKRMIEAAANAPAPAAAPVAAPENDAEAYSAA
jgi:ribosomal protein L12E/L44/L45/RPP1/RPP2